MDKALRHGGGMVVVRVLGELNPEWADYFEGFSIEREDEHIVLTGEIADHSALVGLIDKLYLLGLELKSLERATASTEREGRGKISKTNRTTNEFNQPHHYTSRFR